MFGILLKKQMTEIFRGYFYDAKKNKKRSKVSTILFILMYIVIMAGLLGGIFSYLALQLCGTFVTLHMSWLYFLIMSSIAIALGAFGSVFNTFSGLYLSKDNDLLLSMPIPVRSILVARLMGVYLMGLMYSAVVILPTTIVYWIKAEITPLAILGSLLLIFLISMIVLILSCILGWCVAKLSLKLKNKSFVTVLLSLAFIALYYFVYFKAQSLIQDLLLNAVAYGEKVKGKAYPLYLFGRIGEGDILGMILYTLAILALGVLIFWILHRSFIHIATATGSVGKVAYRERRGKRKSEFGALVAKEFGRFTSSPNYMLNCGLGTIFLIVVGTIFLLKGNKMIEFVNQIWSGEGMNGVVVVMGAVAVCLTISMNDMVVPSVSLEGKSLWIAQSLPIQPWNVLRAKLAVQLLLTGIPVIFCDICLGIVLRERVSWMLPALILPFVFTAFMAVFGLFLGIKMPNLTWTNELAPIKQSLSVLISMFGGWALIAGIAILYFVGGRKIGCEWYLTLVILIFAILTVILYQWLKKKGTMIFAQL